MPADLWTKNFNFLTLSWRRSLLYRKQSIDLLIFFMFKRSFLRMKISQTSTTFTNKNRVRFFLKNECKKGRGHTHTYTHTYAHINFRNKPGPTVSVSNIRDIAFYGCSEIIRTRNLMIFTVYATIFGQYTATFHFF